MKRIVEFSNGTFGIRYGLFLHTYQDFKNKAFRWSKGSRNMKDCQTTYEETLMYFKVVKRVSNSKGIFEDNK